LSVLNIDLKSVRGFLPLDEAQLLYEVALQAAALGPVLEIGSYCGRSTLVLAAASRQADSVVFALDHHRGSEEHQPGELFHEAALLANSGSGIDSWPEFRANVDRSGLAPWVIPIVQRAERVARFWRQPLGLLFLDGGHSLDQALADYRGWAGHVLPGGLLAIHDVFDEPTAGGQAPRAIADLALQSGLFEPHRRHASLLVLQRR
jgi:predicted O-methyltransferase YrrM